MTETEWAMIGFDTKDQMATFVEPYVTPIARSETSERGTAWGTGNYVTSSEDGGAWLLTNEHVVRPAQTHILSHLPRPGDLYEQLAQPTAVWPLPVDAAIVPVSLRGLGPSRRPLSHAQFDTAYHPVPRELLFWLGCPGTSGGRHDPVTESNTLYSWFGELSSPKVPVLSQELLEPPAVSLQAYLPDHHVLIHYPAQAAATPNQPPVETRSPHGMSGSLLWDTKRVACLQKGRDWTPELARVCGIIWAAVQQPELVIATRIEHILARHPW